MKSHNYLFKNKVAVVTGAGSGIGKEIAIDFLKAGARVAGVGRRTSGNGLLSDYQQYGKDFLWIRTDVSREPQVRAMVRKVLKTFGQIDILVNNAAVRGPTKPVTVLSVKDWRLVLETNLTGAFLCARECLKPMIKRQRGRIVNISSTGGRMAYPLRASYAASKWGLMGLTVTLAQEVGRHGIQVNAVCPGPVQGAAIGRVIADRAQALGISTAKIRGSFLRRAALGQMVTASDVSQSVLFLCSDAAQAITGQAIDVSAGYHL